ncbi:NO signaling/Golgi transport ligand-binding domain-containing protein [Filobasidium floriforme]|uniref:NO signaling/Golgi transport ligand-binding domain-containing protein n=1 Tax=Filobasidium floriforme TaxID=5210 RepID=UPI001E8DEE96|nr:NO signaling/Golgi transport ligand-binding domain-containing protein [Filobasidium floriforme]KAH8090695.1 NO signaling/Golgi transport ligand-binding domain-containing protein [Filobasidium floriforme]
MFNLQSNSASSSRYSLPASAPSPPPNANQTKRSSSYLSTGFTNLSISGIGSSSSNNDLASPAGRGGEMNILDRPINKSRGFEVGLPAWAFLFSEIVSYSQTRVDSVADLEKRLSTLGREAGIRIISLHLLRAAQTSNNKDPKKEYRLIPALQFIHTQVYRYCFGKAADGLEKSVEGDDEYMLTLNNPPLTQHISIPKDLSQLSCEAFSAGIVEGVLEGLDMPARVTAHTVPTDQFPRRTVVLIKLDRSVLDREEGLGK